MPVGSEQDRDKRRDEEKLVEEIRRLFERYRETARHATEAVEHRREDESPERAPALR